MGPPLLYSELASWWPLLSRPEDYAEEAELFRAAIEARARRPVRELLELGSGGGNTASHLKRGLRLTLSDLSEGMLAVSRALNPECEHVQGDMRALELGREFDAVLVHDAVMYMTDERELAAAIAIAARHCRPGGVVLFAPDDTRETWQSATSSGGHDGADRALRYLSWTHDPDPRDSRFVADHVYLLREGRGPTRVVHDAHDFGLFARATWLELLTAAGLEPEARPYEHSSFEPGCGRELFLGVRP